jgi:hypothetical protein
MAAVKPGGGGTPRKKPRPKLANASGSGVASVSSPAGWAKQLPTRATYNTPTVKPKPKPKPKPKAKPKLNTWGPVTVSKPKPGVRVGMSGTGNARVSEAPATPLEKAMRNNARRSRKK